MILFLYSNSPCGKENRRFATCDHERIKNRRLSYACGEKLQGNNSNRNYDSPAGGALERTFGDVWIIVIFIRASFP